MNITYALYELESNNSLSVTSSALKRQGALLKVIFESGSVGYADCHPWPELGDLPLKEQLENLNQGKLTPLTYCALEFAKIDAEARLQGKQVLARQNIPRSHFLVTYLLDCTPKHVHQMIQQGYTHIKLKVGRDLDLEVQRLHALFLNSTLKLRLDFNEGLTPLVFRQFLDRIHKLQDRIEFIEDPFPFHAEEWTVIQQEKWTLACDRQAHLACHQPKAARVLIVKPALQTFGEWKKWIHQTRIVTSYLGHPLGQMAAAYVASQVDPSCSLVHGLLSHLVYHPTAFSQQLSWQNPHFTLPPGQGFGFDQELQQLEWKSLS
jgi:O-succinylbenzoate synthase